MYRLMFGWWGRVRCGGPDEKMRFKYSSKYSCPLESPLKCMIDDWDAVPCLVAKVHYLQIIPCLVMRLANCVKVRGSGNYRGESVFNAAWSSFCRIFCPLFAWMSSKVGPYLCKVEATFTPAEPAWVAPVCIMQGVAASKSAIRVEAARIAQQVDELWYMCLCEHKDSDGRIGNVLFECSD